MSRSKSKKVILIIGIMLLTYTTFFRENLFFSPLEINSIKQTSITKKIANLFNNIPSDSLFSSEEMLEEGQITDCNADDSVAISYSEAEKIYNRTSTFNHVDIRVNGTFNVNDKTYDIKIQNVSLKVIDGSKTIVNTTFKNNQSYEWRVTGVRVSKNAQVILEFDILLDNEVVRENYVTTYEGKEDFIQAIVDCDMHWGLDFKIDATEIVAVALPNVSYQWTNLPEGFANLPEPILGYEEGATHTLETEFTKGKYIVDEANGKIYTFSGWTEWSNASDNHQVKNKILGNTLTVNSDTIIYGYWTSSDLEFKESTITISQNFINNNNYIPETLSYELTLPSGIKENILYKDFNNNSYQLSIVEEGIYRIKQLNNSIRGFNISTINSSTNLSIISNSNDEIVVQVDLEYKLPTDTSEIDHLGQITFTNEYTKKMGESIYNYPTLEIETTDSITKDKLSGAKYTLTKTDNAQAESTPSNNQGITSFEKIKEGTYILSETTAPKNYYKDQNTYTIVVKLKDNKAEEIYDSEKEQFILIYNYIIEITPENNFNSSTNRLSIVNQEIKGSISIELDFTNQSDISKENYPVNKSIKVKVTNKNGYEKTFEINKNSNWKLNIEDLKLDNYLVKELNTESSIPGYNLKTQYNTTTDDSIQITLSEENNNKTIKIINEYTKKMGESIYNYPTLEIETTDSITKDKLSGAKYTLTKTDNAQAESTPSNNQGITSFEKIKEGTYILSETTAPKNYYKDQNTYTIVVKLKGNKAEEIYDSEKEQFILIYNYIIEITPENNFNSSNSRLSIVNQEIKGTIELNINFDDSSDITKEEFSNDKSIVFAITNNRGFKKNVALNHSNNYKIILENLKLGTYEITEVTEESSIPGYNLVTDYTSNVILKSDDKADYTLSSQNNMSKANSIIIELTENSKNNAINILTSFKKKYANSIYNYPTLEVETTDLITKELLEKAKYTLTKLDNSYEESAQSNNQGLVSFEELKEGEYILTETVAPKNYYKDENQYKISIKLKNNKPEETYDSSQEMFIMIYNYSTEVTPNEKFDITNNRLSISNQEIKGEISIAIEFGKESDLSFTNYPEQKNIIIIITNDSGYEKEVSINSSTNWKAKIDDLKLGVYEIKEQKQESNIPGYTLTVNYDNDSELEQSAKLNLTAETKTHNLIITNTYSQIIEDVEVAATFSVRSVDDNNQPISGAKFELYNSKEKLIDETTSDKDGIATFKELRSSGEYSLVLAEVPEKYNIKERKWKLKVFLPEEMPPLEYDEKTNSFKRVLEYKVGMDNSNFDKDTFTITTERQEQPEEEDKVEIEDDIPLTAENNYRIVYILVTLFGAFGLGITLRMKKTQI